MLEFLLEQLPKYNSVGKPRTNGDNGEYSNIFYKINKFELIEQNTFWLSETPDSISKGWDGAYHRNATYALFKLNNSDKYIWVFKRFNIDNLIFGSLMNPKTRRKESGYYEKYKLISSHVGRKSFTSNLYGKVSEDVIMAIGGWKTSKMMSHYSKISKIEYAQELNNYWENKK